MRHATLCTTLLIACTVFAGPTRAAEPSPAFSKTVQPFLKQYCFNCHGADTQKARIRYDKLAGYSAADDQLWTMVHEMLSAGEMPPKGKPQPSDAQRKAILEWIEREQLAHSTGSTRRLNRRELSGALRDLTGLDVDYAMALPEDGKVAGFDTGASALQDAASSVSRFMTIARRAVDGVRFLEPARDMVFVGDLANTGKDVRKALEPWKAKGAYVKVRGISEPGVGLMIEPKWLGDRGGFEFNVPPPPSKRGVVRLKLVVSVVKPMQGVPNPHLWVTVGGTTFDYFEVTAGADKPHELVYDIQADDLPVESRGLKVTLTNRVEMPYSVKGFENEDRSRKDKNPVPGGTGLFRPLYDKKKLRGKAAPVPFVMLHRLEVDADHVAAWPPADWQADVGQIKDDLASAKRLLKLWMERAWRRPVSDAEQTRFVVLYETLRGNNMSFDNALRAVFQSVLMSGPFRYLGSTTDKAESLAQHAIASRLSFMLWGAPPDKPLRDLAAAGKLRDAKVLNAQVDRLLDDPRSDRFFQPFVEQWFEMGQPITIAMDNIQKQDFRFGRHLKDSMRAETIEYVARLFKDNRPIRELVDSDWTMMNEILARHYGYDGLEGSTLRKVSLRKNDPRGGGVLSHAGIQSMLCWMGDNWVIYRGAWALRHILDDPPPPPPLEVPELNPSDSKNRGKTFKELLVQHQAEPNCAVCHKSMDPLGFAFQNFDLSGRWRDVEHERYARNELDGKIEWRGQGKTRPVDAEGHLPRGETFKSYHEFKQQVVKNYQSDMTRGLLRNLIVYSAGRKPNVRDVAEMKAIMKSLEGRDYPLQDVLKALITSRVFLGQ